MTHRFFRGLARRSLVVAAVIGALTGCAPSAGRSAGAKPVVASRGPRWVSPKWSATGHADHPLVGRWYSPSAGAFVDGDAVIMRAIGSDLVGIGETHDAPDHHAVQAQFLHALIGSGRRPALVLEMIDEDRQVALDTARAKPAATPDALADAVADAVDWAHAGWPAFAMYRPLFVEALAAGAPIIAGNQPLAVTRRWVRAPDASADAAERARLGLDRAWPEAWTRALRDELVADHCGMIAADSKYVDGMVLAQRARDATLAVHLRAAPADGAVLVAGSGHVRNDRGVPWALGSGAPARSMLAIGLLEVDPAMPAPEAYGARFGAARLPFDFVLFTPATARPDPCAR